MTVRLPEKAESEIEKDPKDPVLEDEGEEQLPPVEDDDQKPDSAEEKAHKLELENAEMKGRLSVLTAKPEASAEKISAQEEQYWRTKNVVMGDMGQMDDETFQKKYGMSKPDVKIHYVDYERNLESQKNAERIARMEAENEMLAKHGPTFSKYRGQVQEAINDAAPEVRKDPARLAKFMERTFVALSKDEKTEPSPKPKSKDGERMPTRRIANDFEAPTPRTEERSRDKDKNDQLEGEDLEVGRHFGITTKSERAKYSGRNLEMRFGNGVVLRDPARGFEKVEKK